MEEDVRDHASQALDLQLLTDHETKLLEERAESYPGVRKSSRPRKKSKRVLDSVYCNDIEHLGVPLKKKHRRYLKLKTGHNKDILPDGQPFKCSLCQSTYINNSPAKAKIKKELQPIVKERFGKLLHLCVKCAIALNHTENKGPTPEQRAEFEEEGRLFALRVVEYLNDKAAARLYCSFYQTTKCGCIQCFITGTPAGRKRKTSLSGVECATSDNTEPKQEEGTVFVDDKAEQARRSKYLLGLLKESMAKKQTPNAKKSNEKHQLALDETVNTMKESERFILENRVKLKELGICERGCQKVLCYSNNFLHKKSVGNQPRLKRTRGRAALGRLHELQDLHKMKCCEKSCVKLAERNQRNMILWRERAQQGQKEMWKVLEEMLTSTESGKANCFKFISMVTGCCLTTVQKVYADVLLSKGTSGCVSKREHGMRFHWKRQKELGKRGQTVAAAMQNQSQMADPCLISDTPVTSDQTVTSLPVSEVADELKFQCQPHPQIMSYEAVSSQSQPSFQICGNIVEEKGDKEDIKVKVLQFFENMKDPQEIASVQEMLAKLQRDLQMKQVQENAQQRFTSQVSTHVSGSVAASLSSSSSPLSVMLNSSYAPSCSSSATSGIMSHSAQDQHVAFIHTPKKGRPFVHIKVQQTVPELNTSVAQITQLSSRKQKVSTNSSTCVNNHYNALDVAHSAKEVAPQAADMYTTEAETLSSQLLSQPLDLSNLTTHPEADTAEPNETTPVSLPLGIVSNAISPFVMTPHITVSSMGDEETLDLLPQQVSLFQVLAHPGAENSHLTTQASQILSVYPQPTPLQIQPFPLSTSNNAQPIQFQLVSPLMLGQSDLMIPLNQAGTMSFLLPKQSASDLQNNETFLQALPLPCSSSISHKDSIVSPTSTMQQSFHSISASPQPLLNSSDGFRNKRIPGLSLPSGQNLQFFKNSSNFNNSKQDGTLSSQSLATHEMSEHIRSHNLSINFDQASEATVDAPFHPQINKTLKPQYSHSSANMPSIAVMNFEDIHNTGQDAEVVHQVTNINHYFPSSLLGQASGNIVVGTPSYSSGSFVFDALADSPVKDPLSLPSPSLPAVPVVTSSLLCEMLMRSVASSVSSTSSPHMQNFVQSFATSTKPSQSPAHFQSSPSASSTKSSLLISALKSTPLSSAYCQSLNFNTHTTPSTMSNQPMVMTGKVEQTNFPVALTIGHGTSLAHSQMGMSRLNRQREPPQVGIVHPHISGVKGGTGHTVSSSHSNNCNSSIFNHNNTLSSSTSSSSLSHASLLGESLQPSSSIIAVDSTSLQMAAPVQDSSADIPAIQSYPQQQHLLLSLLLNSQQAASLTDQSLINTPQLASQFNLTALLGNPMINTATLNDDLCQNQSSDNQRKMVANDCTANSQYSETPDSQYIDRSNTLPDQIHMADQISMSIGSQNIILGNASSQQHTEGSQFFQNVTSSNTGHLKLIPLILSGTSGNTSAPNIFPQNGQLLLNMNPCSGLGNISSLSPQNLNRDNSILLNMSPNSSQNMQLLHLVGSAQATPSLPLPSPNIQNIHQSVEVSSASKDQARTFQFNVLPLVNSQAMPQSKPQTDDVEFQNTRSIESHLPTYTLSGPVGPVAEVVHAYKHQTGHSFGESCLPNANMSTKFIGKDIMNCQPNIVSRGDSISSHNIFFSPQGNIVTVNSSKDVPHKAVKLIGASSTNFSDSPLTTKRKGSNLTQIEDSRSDSQTEGRQQVSLIQTPQASTESTMHHQLPFQVLGMVHTQEEQSSIDGVLSSEVGPNVILGSSAFKNIGLSQPLHSFLNISNANQIFLPVQSVPLNRHMVTSQTISNPSQGLQLGQQLPDLHTVFLPTPGSSTANDASPLVSVVELTKNVNTSDIGSSVQASIGIQHGMITSCASTSKHRPIRPKLLPVPNPAPKISLMLVPNKSGSLAYQLAQQLDQTVLSFQQTSEQKENTLSQLQIVSQEPQNSVLPSGTSQQQQNIIVVPSTSQQLENTVFVPSTSQQSHNTIYIPEPSQQQHNNLVLAGNSQEPQNVLMVTGTSQKQKNNSSIQTLPIRDRRYKAVSQQPNLPEILSQQSVAMLPNQSQMTLITYETPEMALFQSGDLKASPLHSGHFEISQNKQYKISVPHDRPMFIDSLRGDSFQTETLHSFDISNLQNRECEGGIVQCGSLDIDSSKCGSSQIATSQLCSLPSGSLQNDTQRLDPQVASQLNGKHIEMVTQQQLHTNASISQGRLLVKSSSGPSTVQTTQPVLKENLFSSVKGHDTRLDTTSTTFLLQSKLIPDNSVQPMKDKDMGRSSQNVTQPSSHFANAISITSQTDDIKASPHCRDVYTNLSSNIPSSNAPASTTQLLQKPKQPSAVNMKNIPSNGDVKPVLEPVQYLQCKEIIDLTDDSPPLSPSSNLQNRGKIVSLHPKLNDHTQSSEFEDLHSLLLCESYNMNPQSTAIIPLQFPRFFQQNLPIENLHVPHKFDQLKQECEYLYKSPSEIVQDNMVLITPMEAPATSHSDIQFESRAFSLSDDLSYSQAFLPSKVSPKQTEDHLNCVSKEICKDKSHNSVSTDQPVQQSMVRINSQEASVELMSAVSNSRLNDVVPVKEDSKRLFQTAYGANSNNFNTKLPSLSVVGTPVTHKQLMNLSSSSTAHGQSRCYSTTSLSSEVTATAPSDQSSSSVISSSPVTSALINHKFHIAPSSPSILSTPLTTTLPSISAVRTPASRKIFHPLTSSTVTFVRTTNTPTDAVGPPNITIMSPAQANSSPLLRFHHDNSSVSTTAAISQAATSASSNPLSNMTKGQSSGLLKLTSSTASAFVPIRIQGSQDTRDSALLLCPGGKDKVGAQSARRLSLENTSQAGSFKEVPSLETYTPSSGSKSTDNQIKSIEPPPPSKPRSRKRQSTVMDLLKNKEKQQAAASSSGFAMNSTPGPVTLMISGAAGSPNLLVVDSSAGQPRVDSNTLNITVKNLQLFGKLTSNADRVSASSAMPPSSQSSGFTILQPNILHASVSRNCNSVSALTSAAVIKESPTASLASLSSTSLADSHINTTNTTSKPPTIYLPVQKVTSVSARSSPFLGNLTQSKLSGHQDAFNQQVTLSSQSSTSHTGYGNRGKEILMPRIGLSPLGETSTNISASILGQSPDLKQKQLQENVKSEAEVQLLLIGQPQVASSSYKGKSTAIDFLPQKSHAAWTEPSYGEVSKFKATKSSFSEDRNQEIATLKFQLLEDSQKKQSNESSGATKKFILLNDKLSGCEAPIQQPNSSVKPSLQVDQNTGQISAKQKLQLKSPQLLQLMKNKQPFSSASVDQSASQDKYYQLKLPSSSVGIPVSDGNVTYRPYSAVAQLSYHQSNRTSQHRDQLPAVKTYPTITDIQLRGIKTASIEADSKDPAYEESSDARRLLQQSQNPLLTNILSTTNSGGTPTNSSSISVSKSSVYSDNQTKTLSERRSNVEENPHINGSIILGHQTSSKHLDDQLLESKTEKLLKRSFEESFKASSDYKGEAKKASFKAIPDYKSELNNAPPAYTQPPRYEVATKDMTRVSRVIEDIYKFPDEGEEPSPPPAFTGWKSQVEPQKFTPIHSGSSNRKLSDSTYESNISIHPLSTESVPHSNLSKSNIKPVPNTAMQQMLRSHYLSVDSPSHWRILKKLRKRGLDRLNSKFSSKKVQFSDVVTSKPASEYGHSITVSSHIDSVPSEVPSDYPQNSQIWRNQESTGIQHPQSFTYLPGQHQSSTEDSQAVSERHPCVAEQLQAQPREYKLKTCYTGQIETSLSKVEAIPATKDVRDKTSEPTYIQREEDELSGSDFEAEDTLRRESHRALAYQHLPKVNHRVSANTFVDYEQGSKRRDEEGTGPVETFKHIDDNQYPFQSGFLPENIELKVYENLCSLISDKVEEHRLLKIQNALRSSGQNVLMGLNKCDDVALGKSEGSIRDLTKRRQLIHDESFQLNTGANHGDHVTGRKHYMTEKKELLPSLADNVAGSNDRDLSFDHQSSFNILSTQGYSKLSKQRLNRTHYDQLCVENFTPAAVNNAHFTGQGLSTSDTSCCSDHFEETRDFPQQTRCDSISASNASSSENGELQPSESPLIRQKLWETNFGLARQMKKGQVHILKDSRSEDFEVRNLESPHKFIVLPERKSDGISSNLIPRGTECQANKELEYRTLSGPDSFLESPTFLASLDGRPGVLSSLESYSCLKKEIKGLRGVNQYLKHEVAKLEKEHKRQRHFSSSDKQKCILVDGEVYYTSLCPSSQAYMVDVDSVIPPRKRHSSSTTALGMLNCSPVPVSEQNRPEEVFMNKSGHQSLTSCGIQPILESENSVPDGHLRGSISGSMFSRGINSNDEYLPPENYIKETRDPFVSSSMSGHSRPNSHLELGIPQYESTRNRYPSSEMKPASSRGVSDGEGFAPLQEHTRHRNPSSSLSVRALFEDPPPYDITQRQRNPSTSSLKSAIQEAEILSYELTRSRNPSSSSWLRHWDYTNDSNFTAVRSRNPSGSSNRRSRPGSSSSDRELPVNMDEFPLFPDFAHTRSRNSSGESIEPTLELLMDPQLFIQYTYQSSDAHIKRTKH